LPSFGEKLKQEREKRKITLDQISSSTKIGTRMLQALEDDKFSQLPGGIFNKGFVRAYARFVGIDEEQTVADYLQASGDAAPPPTEIAAQVDQEREAAENERRIDSIADSPTQPLPWGWFAAILLVIALALSLWSHRRNERAKSPVHSSQTTATVPSPANTSSPAPGSADTASGEGRGVSQDSPVSGAASTSAGNLASAVPNPHTTALQNELPGPGEFVVGLEAREESWISITADGKTHSSELLPAGSERAIRGRKEVVVRLGNAGGVDLRFNGKKVSSGGDFGEVKTITFGPAGILPTSAAPPAVQ
jgi:cytoskeleton protein RodZ